MPRRVLLRRRTYVALLTLAALLLVRSTLFCSDSKTLIVATTTTPRKHGSSSSSNNSGVAKENEAAISTGRRLLLGWAPWWQHAKVMCPSTAGLGTLRQSITASKESTSATSSVESASIDHRTSLTNHIRAHHHNSSHSNQITPRLNTSSAPTTVSPTSGPTALPQTGGPSASPSTLQQSTTDTTAAAASSSSNGTTTTDTPNDRDILETCQAGNAVYMRENERMEARPFSLSAHDFVPSTPLPQCQTVQELLDAVRLGRRVWGDHDNINDDDDNNKAIWVQRETHPSHFVPAGCTPPIHTTPDELCRMLNQWSHVVVLGDSLSRHIVAGLRVGLTNDFVHGAVRHMVQPQQQEPSSSETLNKCRCDGQFSEHGTCRTHNREVVVQRANQGSMMCPHLDLAGLTQPPKYADNHYSHATNDSNYQTPLSTMTKTHPFEFYHQGYAYKMGQHGLFSFDGVHCDHTDSRGVLLLLQGGLHFQVNARATFDRIRGALEHKRLHTCAKHGKLIVIWSSFESQSPSMDGVYPEQNWTNALQFNADMEDIFRDYGLRKLATINWMNMTRGAQTSDGVHKLLNVNYFKAQYLLSLSDMMLKEKMFATLPDIS